MTVVTSGTGDPIYGADGELVGPAPQAPAQPVTSAGGQPITDAAGHPVTTAGYAIPSAPIVPPTVLYASVGLDDRTGRVITNLDHVRQSVRIILATRLSARIMRRTFGSAVPALLGQPLTGPTLLKFYASVALALTWEPRFRLASVNYPSDNSATRLGQGQFGVSLAGDYMPNALSGDFTVAGQTSLVI